MNDVSVNSNNKQKLPDLLEKFIVSVECQSKSDIKQAVRQLGLAAHPDKNRDSQQVATNLMSAINAIEEFIL